MLAVGEKMAVQIDKIIICHARDIVNDELIGLGLLIRKLARIVCLIHIAYMVCEDRRISSIFNQIVKQPFIQLGHHRLYGRFELFGNRS